MLVRGFDKYFMAPHSRYTTVLKGDIEKIQSLSILAVSKVAGVYAIASKDMKQVFIMGHCEYDEDTLEKEYLRDKCKGGYYE